jgi:hypothetical protein
MNTYDGNPLAARFDALAPEPFAGDWDEVLGRAGAARKDIPRLERPLARQGRRRGRLVALAAAALVLAAGTASAFGTVRDFFLDRGFIGLPPKGATPSSPESGELVLFYWGPVTGAEDHGKSRFWLYTDGRMISLREATRAEGANQLSTGYLEQRLTPEGAELLRSEIISTGLIGDEDDGAPAYQRTNDDDDFAIGGEPVSRDTTTPLPDYTLNFQVRDGAQLYRISRVGDLERLVALLTDPASRLPASAWADREFRAYVPSRFEIVYGPWQPTAKLSDTLKLLPASAQGLLRGKKAGRQRGSCCTPNHSVAVDWYHSSATTEEARALTAALADAGLSDERLDLSAGTYELAYSVEAPAFGGEAVGAKVSIGFEPILPHGEATCGPCG